MKPANMFRAENAGRSLAADYARRWIWFLTGLLLMATGAVLSIKSGLGVSPLNSLPYVLSIFSGVDMGILSAMVLTGCVLIQIPILHRRFPISNFLQIVCAAVFGFFISLAEKLLTWVQPNGYPLRLGISIVSIFLIAQGINIYTGANIMLQPTEGLVYVLVDKFGASFFTIKTIFDCSFVILSLLLCVMGKLGLSVIREGTLLAAILIGPLAGTLKKIKRPGYHCGHPL